MNVKTPAMAFVALLVGALVLQVAAAQTPTLISAQNGPSIKALTILGKGIATNPSDPMDFMTLRVGIGTIQATVSGEEKDYTRGVLYLDDVKYTLNGIEMGDGKATGNIYSGDSLVGSFDVSSVMKGDVEIWAGTLTLNSVTYNAYVIEGVRQIKASELGEKISDYCRANGNDTNCRQIMANNYCQNNPNDSRCKEVFRDYCLSGNNLDDTRCREYIKERCNSTPNDTGCVEFALKRAKSYCEENSGSNLCKKIGNAVADFCGNNTDNAGCARVRTMLEENPKLLQNANAIRNRIRTIVANAGSAQRVGTQTGTQEQAGSGTQGSGQNQGGN